ncbi:replication initiator [Streptomyces sp. JHA26]|uniref:replication initiator n=1 Tax=Streptomyces sp. JHA26 TaxID=1917143 RepID=UPI0027D76F73|nr:replication initiator [Streptomyces sp. JHA26]
MARPCLVRSRRVLARRGIPAVHWLFRSAVLRGQGPGPGKRGGAVAAGPAHRPRAGPRQRARLDRRLRLIAELPAYQVPAHAERMIRTAWKLGARRDLNHPKLRAWSHMLGFRGHFSTKTRQYSTTLAQLRQARTDYQHALNNPAESGPEEESTLVLSQWVYAGTGLTPELDHLAALVTPPATNFGTGTEVRGGA